MILNHLSLTNFRAFSRLDVEVPGGIVLLHGDNAQGKTSLLEAVYFLATFTSFLTSQDSQVIHFLAREESIPVARIVADLTEHGKSIREEVRIILQPQEGPGPKFRLRKEILVDGVKKPASQVIGLFKAVVFIPQMTRLVENGPDERRKYLNLVICQVVPGYAQHLTQYSQALTRRNALLKQLAEKGGNLEQLDYWDDLLVSHGKILMDARRSALQAINYYAIPLHQQLSASRESFLLEYQPSFQNDVSPSGEEMALEDLKKRLRVNRRHDIQRGVTTVGVHRDDFRFLINGLDLSSYGSRGQIRTMLQSLKLAEVEWMQATTGSSPVLLLDETLAELDEHRRGDLLETLGKVEQALLTTADLDLFSKRFLAQITQWEIESGQVRGSVSSQAAQPDEDTMPA